MAFISAIANVLKLSCSPFSLCDCDHSSISGKYHEAIGHFQSIVFVGQFQVSFRYFFLRVGGKSSEAAINCSDSDFFERLTWFSFFFPNRISRLQKAEQKETNDKTNWSVFVFFPHLFLSLRLFLYPFLSSKCKSYKI